MRELGEKVAPLARESVQRALRAASTADDLFHAALESEEIGATAEAESAYRNAIAADPAHVAAHINLGRLRHVGKALDEAERLYRRALELEPNHPTARFNLGVVLEDRGATAEAIEQYLEAVRARSARRRRALQPRAALSADAAINRPRCATSRASAR